MKFLHVIGTRPNIVKFTRVKDDDVVVWTGQHYSKNMAEDLLNEFKINPKYFLNLIDLPDMIKAIGDILKEEKPDCVLVYGDTRSTLAGAIASFENRMKIAHIESGVRSKKYDRYEGSVRKMIDSTCDYLFCPTFIEENNLLEERVKGKIFIVGDPHYDEYINIRENDGFVLVTFHRPENVDNVNNLKNISKMLSEIKEEIIFPIHPRTKKFIKDFKIEMSKNIKIIEPVLHKELIGLIKKSKYVITDSGGVSRESSFCGVPVVLYEIDEWPQVNIWGNGDAKLKIKEILLKEAKNGFSRSN